MVLAGIGIKPGSDLVLLAEVAQVRAELERKIVRLAASASEPAACIAHELREDGIDLLPIERGQTRQSPAPKIEPRRRDEGSESGKHAGERGKDDDGTFQEFGDITRVHRSGATEREQRQPAIVDPA